MEFVFKMKNPAKLLLDRTRYNIIPVHGSLGLSRPIAKDRIPS